MRHRALAYVAAWIVATSLGVAISWAGVRDVLHTAVFAAPHTVPVPSPATRSGVPPSRTAPSGPPTSAAPSRVAEPPRTGATVRPSTASPRPSHHPSHRSSPGPSHHPSGQGQVRSFTLDGGRVALAFHPHLIRLVSATPDSGYETQVWDGPGWLRVDFRRGRHGSTIYGIWARGEPRVQFYRY